MELTTIRILGGGYRYHVHMRVCEERSGTPWEWSKREFEGHGL